MRSTHWKIHPPWTGFPEDGDLLIIPGVENVPDLYGDIVDPQLVIFFAGNQYMVVPELVRSFREDHPEYERIYAQTLPPAVHDAQIEKGALLIGNLRVSHVPDVYTASPEAIENLSREKGWFERPVRYAGDRLALMIHEENPKSIHSIRDLSKPGVRVSMPNPKGEGKMFQKILAKAGGKELVKMVMEEKRAMGELSFTQIHHRQTPLRIMQDEADAGPVFRTEALFQQWIGNSISLVEIPDEYNVFSVLAASALKNAPRKKAAEDFITFLETGKARAIYGEYGFQTRIEREPV